LICSHIRKIPIKYWLSIPPYIATKKAKAKKGYRSMNKNNKNPKMKSFQIPPCSFQNNTLELQITGFRNIRTKKKIDF